LDKNRLLADHQNPPFSKFSIRAFTAHCLSSISQRLAEISSISAILLSISALVALGSFAKRSSASNAGLVS